MGGCSAALRRLVYVPRMHSHAATLPQPCAHPPTRPPHSIYTQAMPLPVVNGGFSGDVPNSGVFQGQGIDALTRLFGQGGQIIDFTLRE